MISPTGSTGNNLRLRHRREFLRFLAASPLLAQAFVQNTFAQETPRGEGAPPGDPKFTITTAKDVISVDDMEGLARAKLNPAHWGVLSSGVDDNATLYANINAYSHIELLPRRLVDVSNIDHSIELFGTKWDSPLFICPVGGQLKFHADGELATARAAKSTNSLMILSSDTSYAVEDVAKARGTAPWYQLYMPDKWEDCEKLVSRVEDAGCPAIAWTIDNLPGRNLEWAERYQRQTPCTECHTSASGGRSGPPPMAVGLSGRGSNPLTASWELFDKLRKFTKVKLLLKGVDTGADAKMARERGVDGIIVSNHGGRATETLRPTLEALPEVVDAVNNKIPVLVDGGVRRGTCIFKALAMGAHAVGIGRPYIWGLSAFGQPGVERAVDILHKEFQLTMRQCGTRTVAQITRSSVGTVRL